MTTESEGERFRVLKLLCTCFEHGGGATNQDMQVASRS